MIVAITSLRKGTGRTMLAINMASRLAHVTNEPINIVDLNKSQDVEYYLNRTPLYRTLDDFVTTEAGSHLPYDANPNSLEIFQRKCAKKVDNNLYLTGANMRSSITDEQVQLFLKYSQSVFRHTIIDAVEGNDVESSYFYDVADYVVIVVNQETRSLDLLRKQLAPFYERYRSKLVIVINRYFKSYGKEEIKLQEPQVRSAFLQSDLRGKVFLLPFSGPLINNSNENTMSLFAKGLEDKNYIMLMDELTHYLLGTRG